MRDPKFYLKFNLIWEKINKELPNLKNQIKNILNELEIKNK